MLSKRITFFSRVTRTVMSSSISMTDSVLHIIILSVTLDLLHLLVFPVYFSRVFGFIRQLKDFSLNFLYTLTSLPAANSFPDRLVMFVLQKLENSNERSRVGSLAVLRHLINSNSEKTTCISCSSHTEIDLLFCMHQGVI